MKRITSLLLMACLSFFGAAQTTVKMDADSNYYVSIDTIDIVIHTITFTGVYYKDKKDNVFPIYVTDRQKYFIYRVSRKTGKEYKQYLKIQ